MKNFILDTNPKFGTAKVTINKDTYTLTRIKNNGCVLKVEENGVDRDSVVFTMQDLRALFLLITT